MQGFGASIRPHESHAHAVIDAPPSAGSPSDRSPARAFARSAPHSGSRGAPRASRAAIPRNDASASSAAASRASASACASDSTRSSRRSAHVPRQAWPLSTPPQPMQRRTIKGLTAVILPT